MRSCGRSLWGNPVKEKKKKNKAKRIEQFTELVSEYGRSNNIVVWGQTTDIVCANITFRLVWKIGSFFRSGSFSSSSSSSSNPLDSSNSTVFQRVGLIKKNHTWLFSTFPSLKVVYTKRRNGFVPDKKAKSSAATKGDSSSSSHSPSSYIDKIKTNQDRR
jgi:hypothetical protein